MLGRTALLLRSSQTTQRKLIRFLRPWDPQGRIAVSRWRPIDTPIPITDPSPRSCLDTERMGAHTPPAAGANSTTKQANQEKWQAGLLDASVCVERVHLAAAWLSIASRPGWSSPMNGSATRAAARCCSSCSFMPSATGRWLLRITFGAMARMLSRVSANRA